MGVANKKLVYGSASLGPDDNKASRNSDYSSGSSYIDSGNTDQALKVSADSGVSSSLVSGWSSLANAKIGPHNNGREVDNPRSPENQIYAKRLNQPFTLVDDKNSNNNNNNNNQPQQLARPYHRFQMLAKALEAQPTTTTTASIPEASISNEFPPGNWDLPVKLASVVEVDDNADSVVPFDENESSVRVVPALDSDLLSVHIL